MYTRMVRGALALLIGLALTVAGLIPRLVTPPTVLALDQTIATCDFATFETTLADVQADGGGTIAFDCAGTIVFEGHQTITTDVTVIGNGAVIFDGIDSTRFFTVDTGARLALSGLTLQNGIHAEEGGAIANEGTLEIAASTFSGNNGENGGAIHNANGSVEISASTFSDNGSFSISSGGAIENDGGGVEVIASTFTNNISPNGGAFYNSSSGGGTLIITASSFSGNRSEEGGAIYNNDGSILTITASDFSGNRAALGGAIENQAVATITASTFSDNGGGSEGGAIRNIGALDITASTFSDNTALGVVPTSGLGGAIRNSGPLEITASTFSGNHGRTGGAIWSEGGLDITASTFNGNRAERGGAISSVNTVDIGASILADSVDSDNCDGTFVSEGSNLSDDTSCGFGMDEQGDPNLADLVDNGGPTLTMLPMAPSDAIDTADCTDSSPADQRGAERPMTGCDIGSVEVGATVPIQIFAFVAADTSVDEGDTVNFMVSAYGPDNDNLTYTFDCDDDDTYESSGSCIFPDEGDYTVKLQVCVGDTSTCLIAPNTVDITALNVAPTIDGITTNAPVSQGEPVMLTVAASDPGSADVLRYRFDCAGDGMYEVDSGTSNTAACSLDPARASVTINVLVEDGDGGSDTGSVMVSQAVTLCGNAYTGALSMPVAGGCPTSTTPLALPAPNPTTVCIDPYTRALSWSPMGSCAPSQRPHVVPAAGPLAYCRHLYTGDLRFSWNGQCGPYEQAGVIPG